MTSRAGYTQTRFGTSPVVRHLFSLLSVLLLLSGTSSETRAAGRVEQPAQGRLLIAKRHLDGPVFGRSVVLLVRHDHTGSLGLILNHPTEIGLAEALPDLTETDSGLKLFFGGPVAVEFMVFLVRDYRPPEHTTHVLEDVYFGGHTESLKGVIGGRDPARRIRVFGGVAGWAPGQLDSELQRGDWFVVETDANFMFDTDPTKLWELLITKLQPPRNLARRAVDVGTL